MSLRVRRALLLPLLLLALALGVTAGPALLGSAAPAGLSATAQAAPVLDSPDVQSCPTGQHLTGAHCFPDRPRHIDTSSGVARTLAALGAVLLAVASLGSFLVF